MQESNAHRGDEDPGIRDVEGALGEFMQATEAFLASWTEAVRRFADEPAALRQFREHHEASPPRRDNDGIPPVFGTLRMSEGSSHPLWDRELDG